MSKPGPKPSPAHILKLRQSWRGKNRMSVDNLDQKKPARPIWLKGEAKKCWDNLVPVLHKAGLAVEINRIPLTLLCCAWADFVEAEEALQRQRAELKKNKNKDATVLMLKTKGGAVMENPLLYTRKRAYDQLFKAAACFGLTPADISGVRATDKPNVDDKAAKFFKEGR